MSNPVADPIEDVRCDLCTELGVECPYGYFGGEMKCQVCSYEFVLVTPMCAADDCPCPKCEAKLDLEVEDGQ